MGRVVLLMLALALTAATEPPRGNEVQTVPPSQAVAILGSRVTGPDGKEVGRLIDVLVDAAGKPEAAVIDFGGFMGVGNRRIAVHWSALTFNPTDPKHPVALEMTADQIKAVPEYANPSRPAPIVMPTNAEAAPQVDRP